MLSGRRQREGRKRYNHQKRNECNFQSADHSLLSLSNIRDNKRRGMSAIYIPTLAVFHLSKTQLLYIHSWDEWMDTSRSQRLQIFVKICAKNHTFHNKRKIKSSSTKLSLNGPFPHYQDHNKWWRWTFSLSTMYFDHTVSFWLMMDTSLGQWRPIFGGQ